MSAIRLCGANCGRACSDERASGLSSLSRLDQSRLKLRKSRPSAPWSPYGILGAIARISRVRTLVPILVLFRRFPRPATSFTSRMDAPSGPTRFAKTRITSSTTSERTPTRSRNLQSIGSTREESRRFTAVQEHPSNSPDITPPTPSFNHESDVAEKVIRDGKVDVDALASVAQSRESRGRRHGILSRRQARIRSRQFSESQGLLRVGAAFSA